MKNHVLIVFIFLVCFRVLAQSQTFIIEPKYTNEVIKELENTVVAYEVLPTKFTNAYPEKAALDNEEILIQTRLDKDASFVLGEKIDVRSLSSSFRNIGTYFVMGDDYKSFMKRELVKERLFEYANVSDIPIALDDCNILIADNITGRFYLVQSDFLEKVSNFSKEHRTASMDIDKRRKKSLEKISIAAYSIEEYQSMIDMSKELTARLIIHGRMAEQGTMNKRQFEKWKIDLEEAKKLSDQIKLFKLMYETKGFVPDKTIRQEASENYKDFTTVILKSSKAINL